MINKQYANYILLQKTNTVSKRNGVLKWIVLKIV